MKASGRLSHSLAEKKEFKLSDYLNDKNSIMGLQIPCPFKVYGSFETNCHEHYEILLGTQPYRMKVGEYY